MSIVNTLALESNRQIKINFDGGDLSLLYTGSSFSLWKVTKIIFFIKTILAGRNSADIASGYMFYCLSYQQHL